MPSIEDEYLDVLQNIEVAIVDVYQQHPELTDYEVEKVLSALIRHYKAEQKQHVAKKPRLSDQAEQVYDNVLWMCEWRLGREHIEVEGEDGEVEVIRPEPITIEAIIACLKRIKKSVRIWNKHGGIRGYLHYVSQFIA